MQQQYLYWLLFILCIYSIFYFDNKFSAKIPIAYNLEHKNNLKYYPVNYNNTQINPNGFRMKIQNELTLYYLVVQSVITPIINIIYYPKNIIYGYINEKRLFKKKWVEM